MFWRHRYQGRKDNCCSFAYQYPSFKKKKKVAFCLSSLSSRCHRSTLYSLNITGKWSQEWYFTKHSALYNAFLSQMPASHARSSLPSSRAAEHCWLRCVLCRSQEGQGWCCSAIPYRTQERVHLEINPHEVWTSCASASTILIDPPRNPAGTWALKNVQLWRQFNIEWLPQAPPFCAAPTTTQPKGKSKRNVYELLSHM